jgi:hypothetical protein
MAIIDALDFDNLLEEQNPLVPQSETRSSLESWNDIHESLR